MPPKLLLLDLDDVLADYSRERRCRALAETAGVDTAMIERAVFASGLEKRSDRGEFGLDDYMDRLRSEWGLDIPSADFIAARRAGTRVRQPLLDICESLTGQVQFGIFSNNGHWLAQHAERIVPELMPVFRTRFICSGSLGRCKPDPEAFLLCLQRLGFSPASTLFVDDKAGNVDGARQAGLDAFVYQDDNHFQQELANRGLSTGETHAF
jgi:HAD superfamily hydrolase (TIGR01509 family)